MSRMKLNAILAMDLERGIGKNNTLPWSIPEDWNYFLRVIRTTKNADKINAVLMGRLTWLSIPKGLSPFKPCINLIVTSKLTKEDLKLEDEKDSEKVFIVSSIEAGMELIRAKFSDLVEQVISIGGSEIYKQTMQLDTFEKLYLTRVFDRFDCEVFVEPHDFLDGLRRLEGNEVREDAALYECDYNEMKFDAKQNCEFIFEIFVREKK